MIDGFVVLPGRDIKDRAADFEFVAELGGTRLNIKSLDTDWDRNLDQFAITAELAAAAGMETCTEFGPPLSTKNLSEAVEVVRHLDRPDFRILMDSMHFFRSGGTIDDIAALDPDIFGYIQLSDVPLVATMDDYMEEAMRERMVPGEGELPLLDFLAALPRHLVVGLDIPIRSLAEAGVGPEERMRRCVTAARSLTGRTRRARCEHRDRGELAGQVLRAPAIDGGDSWELLGRALLGGSYRRGRGGRGRLRDAGRAMSSLPIGSYIFLFGLIVAVIVLSLGFKRN